MVTGGVALPPHHKKSLTLWDIRPEWNMAAAGFSATIRQSSGKQCSAMASECPTPFLLLSFYPIRRKCKTRVKVNEHLPPPSLTSFPPTSFSSRRGIVAKLVKKHGHPLLTPAELIAFKKKVATWMGERSNYGHRSCLCTTIVRLVCEYDMICARTYGSFHFSLHHQLCHLPRQKHLATERSAHCGRQHRPGHRTEAHSVASERRGSMTPTLAALYAARARGASTICPLADAVAMMLALCWVQKCFHATCAEKHTLSRSVATTLREWPVLAHCQRRAPECLGAGGHLRH